MGLASNFCKIIRLVYITRAKVWWESRVWQCAVEVPGTLTRIGFINRILLNTLQIYVFWQSWLPFLFFFFFYRILTGGFWTPHYFYLWKLVTANFEVSLYIIVQSHKNYSGYLIWFSDKKLNLYILNLFKNRNKVFLFLWEKQQKGLQQLPNFINTP